jgi:hypothetical protein
MRQTLVLLALMLGGCVELGGIEEIGANEYRIGVQATTDENARGLAEDAAEAAAADFCEAQGQRLGRTFTETDSTSVTVNGGAVSRGDATLRFSCR